MLIRQRNHFRDDLTHHRARRATVCPVWFRTWMQKFASSSDIGTGRTVIAYQDSRIRLSFLRLSAHQTRLPSMNRSGV